MAAAPEEARPVTYALHAAYPNLSTDRAALWYNPLGREAVVLAVYDLLGREVTVLVDAEVEAGRHQAVLAAHGLAGGVYVARLTAGPAARSEGHVLRCDLGG